MQEGKTKFIKSTIILAIVLVAVLIIIAICQTFVLKKLNKQNQALETQNQQIEKNISDADKEIEVRNTQDFTDDYLEQEKGYGNADDVILQTP